jgi:nucleolysin TIA-1/TIAR
MYGMPQPNTYGQYPGFGGYAGAPGTASPGMPQAASGAPGAAGLGLGAVGQPGAADPNAAAAAGQAQGQWAGADPNSYYSNYWGGKFLVLLGGHFIDVMPRPRVLWTTTHRSAGCGGWSAPGRCLKCMKSRSGFLSFVKNLVASVNSMVQM